MMAMRSALCVAVWMMIGCGTVEDVGDENTNQHASCTSQRTLAPAISIALYDVDLKPVHTITAVDNDMDFTLWVIAGPDVAVGTTYDLVQSHPGDLFNCSLCVLAGRQSNMETFFGSTAGSVTFTQLDRNVGGQVTVDLKGLQLRELSATIGAPDPAGALTCLSDTQLAAVPVSPYGCDEMATTDHLYAEGETTCWMQGDKIARCGASDELQYVQTCASGCTESVPGIAQCN